MVKEKILERFTTILTTVFTLVIMFLVIGHFNDGKIIVNTTTAIIGLTIWTLLSYGLTLIEDLIIHLLNRKRD